MVAAKNKIIDNIKYDNGLDIAASSQLSESSELFALYKAIINLDKEYVSAFLKENETRFDEIIRFIYDVNEENLKDLIDTAGLDSFLKDKLTNAYNTIKKNASKSKETSEPTYKFTDASKTVVDEVTKRIRNKQVEVANLFQYLVNRTSQAEHKNKVAASNKVVESTPEKIEEKTSSKISSFSIEINSRLKNELETNFTNYFSSMKDTITEGFKQQNSIISQFKTKQMSIIAAFNRPPEVIRQSSTKTINTTTTTNIPSQNSALKNSAFAPPQTGAKKQQGFFKRNMFGLTALISASFLGAKLFKGIGSLISLGIKGIFKGLSSIFGMAGKVIMGGIKTVFAGIKKLFGFIGKTLLVAIGGVIFVSKLLFKVFKPIVKFAGSVLKDVAKLGLNFFTTAITAFVKTPVGAYVLGYGVGVVIGLAKKHLAPKFNFEKFKEEEPIKDRYREFVENFKQTKFWKGVIRVKDAIINVWNNYGFKEAFGLLKEVVLWAITDNNYLRIWHAIQEGMNLMATPIYKGAKAAKVGGRMAGAALGMASFGKYGAKAAASFLGKSAKVLGGVGAVIGAAADIAVAGAAIHAATQDPTVEIKTGALSAKDQFKQLYGIKIQKSDKDLDAVFSVPTSSGDTLSLEERAKAKEFYNSLILEDEKVASLTSELLHINSLYEKVRDEDRGSAGINKLSILYPRTSLESLNTSYVTGKNEEFLSFKEFSDIRDYRKQISVLFSALQFRRERVKKLFSMLVNARDASTNIRSLMSEKGKQRLATSAFDFHSFLREAALDKDVDWDDDALKFDADSGTSVNIENNFGKSKMGLDIEGITTLSPPPALNITFMGRTKGTFNIDSDQDLLLKEIISQDGQYTGIFEGYDENGEYVRGTAQELMRTRGWKMGSAGGLYKETNLTKEFLESAAGKQMFEKTANGYLMKNTAEARLRAITEFYNWIVSITHNYLDSYTTLHSEHSSDPTFKSFSKLFMQKTNERLNDLKEQGYLFEQYDGTSAREISYSLLQKAYDDAASQSDDILAEHPEFALNLAALNNHLEQKAQSDKNLNMHLHAAFTVISKAQNPTIVNVGQVISQ